MVGEARIPTLWAQRKKKEVKKQRQGGLNPRVWSPDSSALPLCQKQKKGIVRLLREANFQKSSVAEFEGDTRSFAGDREGCCCCVGGTWHGRAVVGGRLALASSRC